MIYTEIMKAYLLRDIDPDTWLRVKAQAKVDQMTAKEVMLELVRAYASNELIISKPTPVVEPTPVEPAQPT